MRSKLLYQRNLIGTFIFKNFYAAEWEPFHRDQNQIESFPKPPENISSEKTHRKANSFEFAYLHVQEKEKEYNLDLKPQGSWEIVMNSTNSVFGVVWWILHKVAYTSGLVSQMSGYIFKGFALS